MKILPELSRTDLVAPPANEIILPHGLIGFAAYRRAEVLYLPDHLPFLWMKLPGPEPLHFVVIEPAGLVPGYDLEIFDEDALQLDLRMPAEALVLNIVTLHHDNPAEATANLVGPLVVNRRTRVGRQLVIANYARYSAHHPLVGNLAAPVGAATN